MIVTAKIKVRPEVAREAEERLLHLVEMAGTEEGILSYVLHRDMKTPGLFFVYEKYRDKAAFQRHSSMAHVQEAFKWLAPNLAEGPELTMYEQIAAFQA
ncbi:putative quinol monooxygenase [Desulfobotulus sp.]|uniref:putative quinol monooxygenase n=1 Tax=Desulfobotulus sp. TaxID=1940337 RepID=UPI002A35AA87|nr:putative quinol monooxygenase [Desulfobotulus sp.]MDY0161625.1 putative quinol monooxygenase [Desulfobotulus sp.]